MENNAKKTGLLVEGGGMKCAYSAGVLDVFLDENVTFDYVMGVSAGAANAASFVAGQRDRNRRFYVVHAQDPRYLGVRNFLKTGEVFGLHFIYGDLTNEDGIDPLDFDAVLQNPAELHFPATNANTGEPRFFSKEEVEKNHYEPFMATCALPVMCKPVMIDGEPYYDGGVTVSLPIEKMLDDGCEKIVAILSKPYGYVKTPQRLKHGYHRALRKYPKTIEALDNRHISYNRQLKQLIALQNEGKALIFYAPSDIEMKTTTSDPAVMQTLYERGVEDAKRDLAVVTNFLATT